MVKKGKSPIVKEAIIDESVEDNIDESNEDEEDVEDEVDDLSDVDGSLNESDEDESPPKKKKKVTSRDKNKPPTNEELNELKETQTLFHSSLFRLQISELLSEVQIKAKRRAQMDEAIKKLTSLITSIHEKSQPEKTLIRTNVQIPMSDLASKVNRTSKFIPAEKVFVIGSYLTETCVKPHVKVDLAVVMPKVMIHTKDYLNFRYNKKKAQYLGVLAAYLRSKQCIEHIKFSYHHHNTLKPILCLKVKGDEGKPVAFNIHVVLEKDTFKLNRFHPKKNNVRKQWFNGEQQTEEDGLVSDQPPTPFYNTSILRDLTTQTTCSCLQSAYKDAPNIREGFSMLRVWLDQRQLSSSYGGFTSFHMSMYLVYLMSKRKINKFMSSYQIVRNTLDHLSKSDWCKEGITLNTITSDPHQPSLEDFHQHFDVVFVDTTGYLNLSAEMNCSTFHRVKHEAQLAIQSLTTPGLDSFSSLFMTKVAFERKFDHVFHIQTGPWLQSCITKLDLEDQLMDHGGNKVLTVLSSLVQYLKLALQERIKLLQLQLIPENSEWEISESPSSEDKGQITVGMLLNPEYATNILEKGPPADSPEAKDFREFWGEKSELRRFKDGSICEAVAWMNDGKISERRNVCRSVIRHVLSRHFEIPQKSILYIHNQLDMLLQQRADLSDSTISCDTGEMEHQQIMKSYDSLCKLLRNLKDLPLTINSIQGTSPCLRFTEVVPPLPSVCKVGIYRGEGEDKRELPLPSKKCPFYTPYLKVICHLEGSGKWPDDLQAFRHLKAAFHIKLGEVLTDQQSLPVHITPTHVDVKKDGFVFRVELAYTREIALMKLYKTPEGMVKYKDTPESLNLEREIQHLPQLTSTLHGLQQQHNSFGAVARLAKRWIASQLLTDYILEEAIELMTAYLYISPEPYSVPGCAIVGFQRWLHLLANHDWKMSPLMVNLNNKFTSDDFIEIPSRFQKERTTLPLMFIATPEDKTMSIWTRKMPTAPLLNRMMLLAQESLHILSENVGSGVIRSMEYKRIFRPPLELYDVILHLDMKQCARRHQALDSLTQDNVICPTYGVRKTQKREAMFMPVTDYDPVQLYLRDLKESYGHLALFFHDKYGGNLIAVLWKPSAFTPQEFKVSHVHGCTVQNKSGDMDVQMVPNVEAIIRDFKLLGTGLVQSVETKTDKWKI
ncbi:hypothetical protein FSP39_002142 [Pinctada imbricata]|uniref:Nucleolar protein 6 n=1 Tax=Pinctada imbricata TaxID=66713 RepID=A0AA88Y709_PINIB|nr:hypothetical protein FSP39_002142 [Pinctada imbricata]